MANQKDEINSIEQKNNILSELGNFWLDPRKVNYESFSLKVKSYINTADEINAEDAINGIVNKVLEKSSGIINSNEQISLKALEWFSDFMGYVEQHKSKHFPLLAQNSDPKLVLKIINHFYSKDMVINAEFFMQKLLLPSDREMKGLIAVNPDKIFYIILGNKKPPLYSMIEHFNGWQENDLLEKLFQHSNLDDVFLNKIIKKIGHIQQNQLSSISSIFDRTNISAARKDQIVTKVFNGKYFYKNNINSFYLNALKDGSLSLELLKDNKSAFYNATQEPDFIANMITSSGKDNLLALNNLKLISPDIFVNKLIDYLSDSAHSSDIKEAASLMEFIFNNSSESTIKEKKPKIEKIVSYMLEVSPYLLINCAQKFILPKEIFTSNELNEIFLNHFSHEQALKNKSIYGVEDKVFNDSKKELSNFMGWWFEYLKPDVTDKRTHLVLAKHLKTGVKIESVNNYIMDNFLSIKQSTEIIADNDTLYSQMKKNNIFMAYLYDFNEEKNLQTQEKYYDEIMSKLKNHNFNSHYSGSVLNQLRKFYDKSKSLFGDEKIFYDFFISYPKGLGGACNEFLQQMQQLWQQDDNKFLYFDVKNNPLAQYCKIHKPKEYNDSQIFGLLLWIANQFNGAPLFLKDENDNIPLLSSKKLAAYDSHKESLEKLEKIYNEKMGHKRFFNFFNSNNHIIQFGMEGSEIFIVKDNAELRNQKQSKQNLNTIEQNSLSANSFSDLLNQAHKDMRELQNFLDKNHEKPMNMEAKIRSEKMLLENINFLTSIKEHSEEISLEDQYFLKNNLGKYLIQCLQVYCKSLDRYESMTNTKTSFKKMINSNVDPEAFKEKIDNEVVRQIQLLEKELLLVKEHIVQQLNSDSINEMLVQTKVLESRVEEANKRVGNSGLELEINSGNIVQIKKNKP